MRELIEKVLEWGEDRGLLDNDDATRQALKAVSEIGEFVDEILKGNKEAQKMELGDVLVTLILTANKLDLDIEDALAVAYDKISTRTGVTRGGIFIKD